MIYQQENKEKISKWQQKAFTTNSIAMAKNEFDEQDLHYGKNQVKSGVFKAAKYFLPPSPLNLTSFAKFLT